MLKLEVSDLEWVKGPADDPSDQCAHGRVAFAIDRDEFVRPADGRWTVSASALFLLRTLEHDHVPGQDTQLFPCCGFSVWPSDRSEFGIVLLGCPSGIDPAVTRDGEQTTIRLGGRSATTSRDEWRAAVLRFAGDVLGFYERSQAKEAPPDDEDRRGWAAFWREFHERRGRALKDHPRP